MTMHDDQVDVTTEIVATLIQEQFPQWSGKACAGELTAERAAAFTALDPWWKPPWPIAWQRAYRDTRRGLTDAQTAPDAGEWLQAQRAHAPALHPEQQRLLTALGVDLHPESAPTSQHQLPARERSFQRGLAAARAFLEREGHLKVPQRHVEDVEGDLVRLGQWLTNLRCRKETLSAQGRQALTQLGL